MTNTIQSEYNSQLPPLIISEYGRNVQELIQYCKTVEDPEERQQVAESIVEIMRIVNPQKKTNEDLTDKLWKHFFRIAEYDIDVVPPSGEQPKPEDAELKPEPFHYPAHEARFRHYGHHIQVLVRKALEMEDGPIKDDLVTIIGSYMKLAYKTWNREHYVSDEFIKSDLVALSDNKLSLDDDVVFDTALAPITTKPQSGARRKSSRSNRGRSYRGRRRR